MEASHDELRLALSVARCFAAETAQSAVQHEHDLFVMYALLRRLKPDVYIELGRGQGCSTLLAALAMAANGVGAVLSYDLYEFTAHDLPMRLRDHAKVDIDLRVGDIRDFTRETWRDLAEGRRKIAVLVDAHEETGRPIADVLLPFVRNTTDIEWLLMFHDVLYVEDGGLFDAFDESYRKSAPFVSPYPEYEAILPAARAMNPSHFAKIGTSYDAGLSALGVRTFMPPGRSARHRFIAGADPADIDARFSKLRSSSMMAILPDSLARPG